MLSLGALGVVFGDIGTSPLYALKECFMHYGLALNDANIFGILSLIFWTLIVIIGIKYMAYVMRADNKGEGGILSLMALCVSSFGKDSVKARWFLTTLGIFGAALLFGDGIITPAMSVLSALEGLSAVSPDFEPYILPSSILVLTLLFAVQKQGTGKIGVIFGPVILLWFIVLGILGVKGILLNPHVLEAMLPHHAVLFFIQNQWQGFVVLGSVFLVVTGGEALYADMGHFGKQPIRYAWFIIAMPALVLNYFGQGALLMTHPEFVSNPFYNLAPSWALMPLVVLATLSAVIASQALITGVYSITRQAIQLGLAPRLSIVHTSSHTIGQIYIPSVNWCLYIGVLWLVLTFKTSSSLAAAYGIAVTGTMVITTILAFEVARKMWKWTLPKSVIIFGIFLIIDLAFFGASALKIIHGGWVPLVIGLIIYTLSTTWQRGRHILYLHLKARSMSVREFCEKLMLQMPDRVKGTTVYLAGDPSWVPLPLLLSVKHYKVLHERVALLNIHTQEQPFVDKNERVVIEEFMPNFYQIRVTYGFMETPKMKHIIEACRDKNFDLDLRDTTFVLGRETIIARPGANEPGLPSMAHWRERIFVFMAKSAQRPTAFFRIPPNNVIELGVQVEF